jgi:transcriptional regulatory protein LevR
MTDTGSRAVKMGGQSFIVNIKCTQNHTWQGNLTWVEQKKTLAFRSALELIKLIDSAMEIAMPEEERTESW